MKHSPKSKRLYLFGIALILLLGFFTFETVFADEIVIFTFNPAADSFIVDDMPGSNQGSAPLLRTRGTRMQSFLRFDVQDLVGSVTTATLRLYVNSNYGSGYAVYYVSDNSWQEASINYTNAPALEELIYTSETAVPNTWIEVDVTPYVQADGVYNFAIVGTNDQQLTFSSRDGSFQPELYIVDPAGCGGVCPPDPTNTE